MFEFITIIFNKAISVMLGAMAVVGLVSAPIQPLEGAAIVEVPTIQEKVPNKPEILPTKPKPVPQSSSVMTQSTENGASQPLNDQLKLLQQKLNQLQQSQAQQSQAIQKVQEQTPSVPVTEPIATPPKPNLKSLQIIKLSPSIAEYKTSPVGSSEQTEDNYVTLGLIYRNENGDAVIKYDVSIEATDPPDQVIGRPFQEGDCWMCRRFMKGTGTDQTGIGAVTKIWEGSQQKEVSYYPFHYDFRTVGKHVITFTSNGMSASIEFEAK